jgi:hypothetical protein
MRKEREYFKILSQNLAEETTGGRKKKKTDFKDRHMVV